VSVAANLTPQYLEAERKLKTAKTPQERLEIMQEMMALMPKHKATEKLQAGLKAKISKLKEEIERQPSSKRGGVSHLVPKQGAGQVVVIGAPNSGKSLLIKALTGADPEVGEYAFTTRTPAPYMMKHGNTRVQLVDLPPMSADLMESWQVELVKTADAALMAVDLSDPDGASRVESLAARLKEKRVEFVAEDFVFPEEEAGPPVFRKRTLLVGNKTDLDPGGENLEMLRMFFGEKWTIVPASAATGGGIDGLRGRIFSLLHVIRIYSKVPGKKADSGEPFILKRGSTVLDAARAVHKDFADKLNYARLWRKDAINGLMVNRDQTLEDEDVLELHL
jgi:ribosome-interacting GTPase 1